MSPARPTRRQVLRAGAVTAAAAAVTTSAGTGAHAVAVPDGVLELHVNEGYVPMVDGTLVYMRGFGDRPTLKPDPAPSLTCAPRAFLADGRLVDGRTHPYGAPVPPHGRPTPSAPDPAEAGTYLVRTRHWASIYPRRTIIAEEGATVRLQIRNNLAEAHRFAVTGIAGAAVTVRPGQTVRLDFTPTTPGVYLYSDPLRAPVERVLGLYGVLLVVPRDDPWRAGPGSMPFERQWLWMVHDVDPVWAQIASQGGVVDPVARPPVPRYFTLNDRSGYRSLAVSEDEASNEAAYQDTLPSGWPRRTDVRDPEAPGRAGQVVRMVNAGIAVHQMHFHGNHIWTHRRENRDLPRNRAVATADGHIRMQQWEDVVELDPLQRADVVLPLKPPPDVVPAVWAARTEDWIYPMHCHAEMSQTAGGGVYPGGLVADWILAGGTPSYGGS
jgi:hypothetical protein